MANDQSTPGATPTATSFPMAFINTDWIKLFSDAPTKFYAGVGKEMLTFTARRLQAQADFVGKLTQCSNPGEVLACNTDFLQKSTANWVEEGQRIFAQLRTLSSESKSSKDGSSG